MAGEKKSLRTEQQNRAIHLYCTWLADTFNAAGLDMKKVLKPTIDIPWSKDTVKEYIWRPIQFEATRKKSTRSLAKQNDIDDIYAIINRHIGEKFGVHVPFPNMEDLMREETAREEKLRKDAARNPLV